MTAPTLDEVKAWPATVSVPTAARALGICSSTAYEWIRLGEFPVAVINYRGRRRVITAGLVRLLSDPGPGWTHPEMVVAGPPPTGDRPPNTITPADLTTRTPTTVPSKRT